MQSDKKDVLTFCTNTFEWGDYIEQVWDVWYSDPNGYLIVAEDNGVVAAISHAYLCPNRNTVWLEGIRVNPDFRRRCIGTDLIKKMVQYGKEQGAREAGAVVSVKNVASQAMMEKNGFVVTSRWSYSYRDSKVYQKSETDQIRTATLKDKEIILSYLKQSQIFSAAAENYVDFWRWYRLDLNSGILQNLIDNKKVIIMKTDHSKIDGLTIVNKYNNMFQIGYLDAFDALTLSYLVRYVFNLVYYEERGKRYEKVRMFCPQIPFFQSVIADLGISEYGQFLLYNMVFSF
jgi:RimJ/RimL family protein N-acetyltransferase